MSGSITCTETPPPLPYEVCDELPTAPVGALAKTMERISNAASPDGEAYGFPTSIRQQGDSKEPDGPILTFTPGEWNAFIKGVKDGEFG